jgi:hypothetical protein
MTTDADRERYLWDRTGEPEPEVERLEALLGPLRHRGSMPALPARDVRPPHWLTHVGVPLAAAAVIVLMAATAWFAMSGSRRGWDVAPLAGAPRIDASPIDARAHLAVGGWLETDASSRARIAVGEIGIVDVDPNTRVGLLAAEANEHRLALDRGVIHARIAAPPRLFFVNTPSAVAVDLGCAYTLEVGETGQGRLRVTAGWVGFEHEGRASFIPEGAVCLTRPGIGPGTPHFEDAAPGVAAALATIDFGEPSPADRTAAVDLVLAEARPRDALTLWHLLARTEGTDRARVYNRMALIVPPPAGVTREGVLGGNRGMLDLWWAELGRQNPSWPTGNKKTKAR